MKKNIIKTVIINRAVPGSGKTTISKSIMRHLKAKGLSLSIHSTDDFFMIDGKYYFDITKLYEYHLLNIRNFEHSLQNKTDIVICDNTNIAPWQTKLYSDLARFHGIDQSNLFLTGDLQYYRSDIQGRAAVGGSARLKSFSMGEKAGQNDYSLIVRGNLEAGGPGDAEGGQINTPTPVPEPPTLLILLGGIPLARLFNKQQKIKGHLGKFKT